MREEAPTQRHLYLTEWRQIEVAGGAGGASAEVLVISDKAKVDSRNENWAAFAVAAVTQHASLPAWPLGGWPNIALAVANHRGRLAASPLFALEVALALVQTQAVTIPTPNVWLLTMGSSEHAGSWGLSRSVRAEASLPLMCMQTTVTLALASRPLLHEPEAILSERKSCAPRLKTASQSLEGLVRLHFHARGAISNLFLEPLSAPPPLGDVEVLLRVHAVGLNFRDVLNVLGEYHLFVPEAIEAVILAIGLKLSEGLTTVQSGNINHILPQQSQCT